MQALEDQAEKLDALRRQLQLEWEDASGRLRSALGRLDKHASRQEARSAAPGPDGLSDAELAARLFTRRSSAG